MACCRAAGCRWTWTPLRWTTGAPLDQRDGAAVAFATLEPNVVEQMARDHALHHLRHRRDQLGCAASNMRSGIGSDSTHCRTGTCGMTHRRDGY